MKRKCGVPNCLSFPATHQCLSVEGKRVYRCLTPNHKVLTADLRYVELGALNIGDPLLAFDEDGPQRHYRKAFVEKILFEPEQVVEVTLSNNKMFTTTADHMWLSRMKQKGSIAWKTTNELRWVFRLFPEIPVLSSWDAGYLAGVLDGEGSIVQTNRKKGFPAHIFAVSLTQRENACLAEVRRILTQYAIQHSVYFNEALVPTGIGKKDCRCVYLYGGRANVLALLGGIRPARLLAKLDVNKIGQLQQYDSYPITVEEIKSVGTREVAKITTSTGTFIIEGYPHHNCKLHLCAKCKEILVKKEK